MISNRFFLLDLETWNQRGGSSLDKAVCSDSEPDAHGIGVGNDEQRRDEQRRNGQNERPPPTQRRLESVRPPSHHRNGEQR